MKFSLIRSVSKILRDITVESSDVDTDGTFYVSPLKDKNTDPVKSQSQLESPTD